jgi:DNA-binding NtrC family response regulator
MAGGAVAGGEVGRQSGANGHDRGNGHDSTATLTRRRFTLLIVDDEFGVRESLRQVAEHYWGSSCSYLAAETVERARWFARNIVINVAIVDLRIGAGLDGLPLVRELTRRGVRVLVLTGHADPQNVRDAIGCGAVEVISKPFDVAGIAAKVGALVAPPV